MPEPVTPPPSALWLLRLFAGELDISQIEGDLLEEFHQRIPRFGARAARRWYRREVLRTAASIIVRPRLLTAVGAAALSVVAIRLATRPFFRWLQLELLSAPRTVGLGWTLRTGFEVMVAGIVGLLVGSVSDGRGRVLRLAFSTFFVLWLAYWLSIRGYLDVWLTDPIRGPLDVVESALIVASYCAGSFGAERMFTRRRLAA
jgi:hypothetical protein